MVGSHYVQNAGGLWIFRPDLFNATNPPALTAKQRRFPVWFGPPQEVRTEVNWELPEGWIAELNEAELAYECEGASVKSAMALIERGFRSVSTYRQTGRLVLPEDYESARQFSANLTKVRGQVVMVTQP
jgi:hypothetical protein